MSSWGGSAGALAGAAGALLLALGCVLLRELPSAGASELDVYAYFLDHRDGARLGAAVSLLGVALLVPFLAALRAEGENGPRGAATLVTLTCGALAVGAASFAAAVIGGLAVSAENADPGSSRTLLDAAGALFAAAGPLLALAIAAAAIGVAAAGAPRPLVAFWALAAFGCLLWIGPLVTDASALEYGSVLGTFAGAAGLIAWTLSAAAYGHRTAQ